MELFLSHSKFLGIRLVAFFFVGGGGSFFITEIAIILAHSRRCLVVMNWE